MTTQCRHDVFKLILIVLAICDNIMFMNCNNIRRNSRTGRRITREMKVDAILKDIRKGKNDIRQTTFSKSSEKRINTSNRNKKYFQFFILFSDIHNVEERVDDLSSRFDSFYSFQKLLITQMGRC